MRFQRQHLFAYEPGFFQGATLDQLLATKPGFPLSGLADLRETLFMTEDAFRNYPVLRFKERDFGEVDKTWLESKDTQRRFSRSIEMRCFVKQDRPGHKREPWGEQIDRPTSFHLATVLAWRHDYVPSAGDHVPYRDQVFELTRVYVDPEDYFQQSAFPLYLRCDAKVVNYDSRLLDGHCGTNDQGLAEAGSASRLPPLEQVSAPSPFLQPVANLPLPVLVAPSDS